ncbi:MAG: hypothetical protein KAS51_07215 [Candidatus Omnitrophica bacterium]|nr:hypothetical protein [Candidatus Omnitrophota bacterium]
MRIKYKTSIEEAIDCRIRLWWLRKSSYKTVLMSFLLIPVTWFFMAYLSNYEIQRTIFKSIVFTLLYGSYLIYSYGPGYRKKIKKMIIESLNGKPFPNEFECEINEEGINHKNTFYDIKIHWPAIKEIRPYKQYIEIVGIGSLVQIKQKDAPPIGEIIAIWKKNSTYISNQSS